ncbi:MAG: ATP-dependent Clp protease ATP-binding subunit [bacterium]
MKGINLINDEIKNLDRVSKNLSEVIIIAFDFARKRTATALDSRDLFMAIIQHHKNIAARLLERLGVDLDATISSMSSPYQKIAVVANTAFGEEAQGLISKSFLLSSGLGHVYVGTEHMLLAILSNKELDFVQDLAKNGLDFEFIRKAMINFGIYQPGVFTNISEQGEENDEEMKEQTALYYFARDMNKLAQEGKFLKVWGREKEIERLIHILSRRTKNNPMLVGEAGVGKTAIVQGLVQRIVAGKVPNSFRNKTVVQLDLSAIIAGSKIRGDIEERLLGVINELSQNPDLILFIDEIHMIVGAGAAGSGSSMDVANILKPHLTSGELRVIGATTYDEFQRYIEEDDALARRFQPIMVDEISVQDAENVLKMLKPSFEEFHKVKITDEAISLAVELSDRYVPDKYLPDKAIDVIDEATAAKKIKLEKNDGKEDTLKKNMQKIIKQKEEALDKGDLDRSVRFREEEIKLKNKITQLGKELSYSKGPKSKVTEEDIREVISRLSKVPVTTLENNQLKLLQKLADNFEKRIIGQNKAIIRIAAALKRARIGFSDEKRPLASFLFLGPTGVGKTETAKEIARTLFGSEEALIQVDMSEFMEQHSVSKLIGSPPGYVGYQEGGHLTEKVRRKPYSVVLFDEIEKAHPDFLNILLQILEEGNVEDSRGRNINFKNTVIILTSNIGAHEIGDDSILGFGTNISNSKKVEEAFEKMKERLTEELKDTLPPEFINRIDDVIIYRGLDKEDAVKIARLLVKELNERLKSKEIQVVATDSIIRYIAEQGFSKDYGARNIKRKIQELIENPLADYVINHKIDFSKKHRSLLLVKVLKEKNGIKLI